MDEFEYIHLKPSDPLPESALKKPFAAVVIIDAIVSNDWRNDVSCWLVETGCLYMMAWGNDCSLWDDSVDWVNLEAHQFGDIPDHKSVMTTWHENEPLGDVFWFANNVATHPNVLINHLVVLDINETPREQTLRDLFAKTANADSDSIEPPYKSQDILSRLLSRLQHHWRG